MDKCIPLINKLQEVQTKAQLRNSPIQLPQIVVVGSQSSGKSSVLESFVGYPFLPRGKGIVTRRPLILQLVQTPPPIKNEGPSFSAKFNHNDKIMTDFNDVLNEIQAETNRIAGVEKGISREPILLTVKSDKVINLTVVDLPGIVKNPVGDQPKDIEEQIRKLIKEYITIENSIILAVSPANTDMATSEAVKMAKEVDPSGERTLAVITKLDLMDKGTDATDCLEGRVIPVKLGIIGVINRSQLDINNNKSIEDSLLDEKKFLEEKYPTIASINGTAYLATTLSRLLMKHIEKCIPDLKAKIVSMIQSDEEELRKYGDADIKTPQKTLCMMFKEFSDAYCQSLDGSCKVLDTTKLKGGARIFQIIKDIFPAKIDQLRPLENLNSKDMLTAMRNATGVHSSLNVSQNVLTSFVSQQLSLLQEPSLKCVKLVHLEMTNIIKNCEDELEGKMSRFPVLRRTIRDVVLKLLEDRLEPAERLIKDLIAMEKSFVDFRSQDFVREWKKETEESASKRRKVVNVSMFGGPPSIQGVNGSIFSAAPRTPQLNLSEEKVAELIDASVTNISDGSREDINEVEDLIKACFLVASKSIKDKVPKAVMYTLVNHVKDHLHDDLLDNLLDKDDPMFLLQENPQIREKRIRLIKVIQTLKESEKILDDFEEEVNFIE